MKFDFKEALPVIGLALINQNKIPDFKNLSTVEGLNDLYNEGIKNPAIRELTGIKVDIPVKPDFSELRNIIEDKKIPDERKIFEIWKYYAKEQSIDQKTFNVKINDSNLFNKGFLEFLQFYRFKVDNNPFICSKNTKGKYSLNFTFLDNDRFLNKVSISNFCKGSIYFPKSFIVNNKEEYDTIDLNPDKKYFVKPQYCAGSQKVGISMGKNIVFRPELIGSFPLVFQENVENLRLCNSKKEDERIFILYLKHNKKIRTFMYLNSIVRICKFKYSNKIEKKTHFTINDTLGKYNEKRIKFPCESNLIIPLVKDISPRILSSVSKQMRNNHKAEFWLTGWDVIFDKNNFPWLLEINSRPNQCESMKSRIVHYQIYQQILDMMVSLENNVQFQLNDFIEIT